MRKNELHTLILSHIADNCL